MLLTGIGVGLTLPTLMATAASSLPPQAFATGSAVVNMLRQVGLAIGVAVLIAVLGSPGSPAEALTASSMAGRCSRRSLSPAAPRSWFCWRSRRRRRRPLAAAE